MFLFTIQKKEKEKKKKRKRRDFFFQQNEMQGEHFILGIMTECCRYFYGAMMPECNFYSQFKLENNVSLQN